MAYLYRRSDGRVEIREAVQTARGPRSRTLASFREPLTRDALEAAEARARRPFDRAALLAKAAKLGVEIAPERADPAARALLGELRRGAPLDPRLAVLLRAALDERGQAEPGPGLEEAAEWIGASPLERGRALRDVLRFYGQVAGAREPVRERPPPVLERFRSRERRAS